MQEPVSDSSGRRGGVLAGSGSTSDGGGPAPQLLQFSGSASGGAAEAGADSWAGAGVAPAGVTAPSRCGCGLRAVPGAGVGLAWGSLWLSSGAGAGLCASGCIASPGSHSITGPQPGGRVGHSSGTGSASGIAVRADAGPPAGVESGPGTENRAALCLKWHHTGARAWPSCGVAAGVPSPKPTLASGSQAGPGSGAGPRAMTAAGSTSEAGPGAAASWSLTLALCWFS